MNEELIQYKREITIKDLLEQWLRNKEYQLKKSTILKIRDPKNTRQNSKNSRPKLCDGRDLVFCFLLLDQFSDGVLQRLSRLDDVVVAPEIRVAEELDLVVERVLAPERGSARDGPCLRGEQVGDHHLRLHMIR